jgi:hypothetical protein
MLLPHRAFTYSGDQFSSLWDLFEEVNKFHFDNEPKFLFKIPEKSISVTKDGAFTCD